MLKGWHLVSLYTEESIYVDFAHYTGRYTNGGGLEYDKVLKGNLSYDELRKALRKHLSLEPGNKQKRRVKP